MRCKRSRSAGPRQPQARPGLARAADFLAKNDAVDARMRTRWRRGCGPPPTCRASGLTAPALLHGAAPAHLPHARPGNAPAQRGRRAGGVSGPHAPHRLAWDEITDTRRASPLHRRGARPDGPRKRLRNAPGIGGANATPPGPLASSWATASPKDHCCLGRSGTSQLRQRRPHAGKRTSPAVENASATHSHSRLAASRFPHFRPAQSHDRCRPAPKSRTHRNSKEDSSSPSNA